MVECIHVEIGKYLTGEVAYWQSAIWRTVKQAFVVGQIVPIAAFSFNDAVFCWVVENGFATKPYQ